MIALQSLTCAAGDLNHTGLEKWETVISMRFSVCERKSSFHWISDCQTPLVALFSVLVQEIVVKVPKHSSST